MTLDISIHKTILFQILKSIYSNTKIAPYLGFKGGTAALMFYGLDRFSVDLDFDLLNEDKIDTVYKEIDKILLKYGTIKEKYNKHHTLFFLLSYEEKMRNVKIEISKRPNESKYELKNYLGIPMLVMTKEDMFANKLMAMSERMDRASRDIYDVWFFLKNRFPINEKLIQKKLNITLNQLIKDCIVKLNKIDNRQILSKMGELLTVSQKDWARNNLKKETIALLKLRIINSQ